jgi:hypothetical protein
MLWKSQEIRENVMNMRTPLAAAFLIMASSAMAQFGNSGSLSVNNFSGTSPLNLGGSLAPMEDVVFKCSTPPWRACTDVDLNKRQQVLGVRACPLPASAACQNFLMANAESAEKGSAAMQLMGNQSNPATANDGIFMKCDTVPYRPCGADDLAKRAEFLRQEAASHQMIDPKKGSGAPGGPPPAPTAVEEIVVTGTRPLPPPFDAQDFAKELADARSDNPKKVVDLGGNRFGVVNDDGTVNVCGKGQCDLKPRSPDSVPGLADAMQLYASINSGNTGAAGSNKGAGTPPPARTTAATQTPPPDSSGARNMGGDVAALQNEITGNKFGASSAGSDSGGSGGSDGSGAGATGGHSKLIPATKAEIAAALAKLDTEGYTFIKNREAAEGTQAIIREAEEFTRSNGRPAEPPVNEKLLGKIQAGANSKP